jgi:uncharacterized protein (TIGR03435 family)
MSGRQTERLARSVFFARYEATQWAQGRVAPEHLLLGLLREGKRIGPVLEACGLTGERVRRSLTGRLTRGHGVPVPTDDLPLTEAARQALERADAEAVRQGESATDVAHLLIGLLLDESSLATAVLTADGLTLARARLAVGGAQAARPRPSDPGTARITPARDSTNVSSSRDLEHWTVDNTTLRELLSAVHHVSIAHIVLPEALDDEARYDADTTAPSGLGPLESLQALDLVLGQAINAHFGVTTARETRPLEVYVLTAPDGIRAARESDRGGFTAWTTTASGPDEPPTDRAALLSRAQRFFAPRRLEELDSFSGSTSMSDFCEVLQRLLRRPVLDETGDAGTYRLEVRQNAPGSPVFVDALRETTGLVLTPDRRNVDLLIVRPAR